VGLQRFGVKKTADYSVDQPTDAFSKIQQNTNYKTILDKYQLLHVSAPECHPQ